MQSSVLASVQSPFRFIAGASELCGAGSSRASAACMLCAPLCRLRITERTHDMHSSDIGLCRLRKRERNVRLHVGERELSARLKTPQRQQTLLA